jgi:hypothetical protein
MVLVIFFFKLAERLDCKTWALVVDATAAANLIFFALTSELLDDTVPLDKFTMLDSPFFTCFVKLFFSVVA